MLEYGDERWGGDDVGNGDADPSALQTCMMDSAVAGLCLYTWW